MTSSKKKETMQRFEVLNKSNDGFYIANEDLKLRDRVISSESDKAG